MKSHIATAAAQAHGLPLINLAVPRPKLFVDTKMEEDPTYAPYCMRCVETVRMVRISFTEARCHCGARHIISPTPNPEQTP